MLSNRGHAKGAQNLLSGKRPLIRKISKFHYKTIEDLQIYAFLPSFVEIGKVEMTKSVRDIYGQCITEKS